MARAKRPERSIAIEKWTWRQAEEALFKNNINRHIRENDVDKYTRSMSKKLWGVCTEPIVFDWDGNLIDGQHRLIAQVKSKTNQEWIVYRNVAPETQKNINTGIPRSAFDQLRFEGYQNSVILASVARWSFMLENGNTSTGRFKVSHEEIIDMVNRHPELVHSAYMGTQVRNGFVEMSPSPMGAAHWWISQNNEIVEADIFVYRFAHMNREPDGSPILAMMRRFAEARRHKMHIPTRVQIAMIVKTWNYDVKRMSINKMNLYSRTGEAKLQDVLVREVKQEVQDVAVPLIVAPSADLEPGEK